MKKSLSFLLMLIVALQSLIASADVHHALELPTVAVHEHEIAHAELACHMESVVQGFSDDGPVSHQHHCCHSHCAFAPFLIPQPQRLSSVPSELRALPLQVLIVASWVSAPDFRPPIV